MEQCRTHQWLRPSKQARADYITIFTGWTQDRSDKNIGIHNDTGMHV